MGNRTRGFTLIEMIIAIAIISVGLTGLLAAFQIAVRSSADPMIRKQLLAIAEEMTEEVLLRPYTDPQADAYAAPTTCARRSFDDIGDFEGYDADICDMDGNAITTLAGYRVSIRVEAASLNGLGARRIAVTATRGSESVTLVSYRTDWTS